MQKTTAAIVLLASSLAANGERLGFETIILEWPDGYHSQARENQIQMAGPNGEHVTIMLQS